MQTLQKSTYSQTQSIDADPVKHLENSTSEYLHVSFLLWEYKRAYSKAEYRELLKEYCWDKGSTEEKRALKLAEHFQDFIYRPQALTQIPVTTLLKLCSEKYSPLIEELKQFDDEDITCDHVFKLIKDRAAQLKKEKESQIPQKPSIWKRNCRQERYAQYPPLYEKDEQTGILTQKLMDEYGLAPQYILRESIFNFYNKYTSESVEESIVHDVEDKSQSNDCDNNEPDIKSNQIQTVEEKWFQLNQQLKTDIEDIGEVSQENGQLIFESCQQWEAAVPSSKKWSAIGNICGYQEKLLKHLSNYAYGNHSEWRHSWGAILASYNDFEQELEWVGINLRTDVLIAMGYKIPAIVKVNDGSFGDKQGRIIELHGDNDKPILVKFEDFQGYFHWSELDIVTEAETFAYYTSVEPIKEEEYLEEPEESDIELKLSPLETAIKVLINGSWEDIRDVFNQNPGIKGQAWSALNNTQRKRVIDITPEIVKVLNQAKREGVIAEYKEIAVGVYQVKLPGKLLWEQRAYHEIEMRHYLRGWREAMLKKVKTPNKT